MQLADRAVFIALLISLCASIGAHANELAAFGGPIEPGTHILMRHAEAPGVGDPPAFRLNDCSTQRNLSETGRDQARRIGEKLKKLGIRIDHVLSSQWCRARDTAALLDLGAVTDYPPLNSFFSASDTSREQSTDVRQRLKEFDQTGERALLVTHQVNITALTGVFPASGEMILVRVVGDKVEVDGRITLPAAP